MAYFDHEKCDNHYKCRVYARTRLEPSKISKKQNLVDLKKKIESKVFILDFFDISWCID
jgi:hypothetical protein